MYPLSKSGVLGGRPRNEALRAKCRLWGSSPPQARVCFWVPIRLRKQPSTGSLRDGWGLHLARWCEVRGWIPSASLACWEGDLEMKHSEPSADSGARANLRPGCVFGCRFACVLVNSPPRDQAEVTGGFTWRVGEKLEVVSPQQVWRAGRETLN